MLRTVDTIPQIRDVLDDQTLSRARSTMVFQTGGGVVPRRSDRPAPTFATVLAITGPCKGLLAGPVAAIQLTRTPTPLRPKVMTALLSASLLGTLTAGQSLHTGFTTGFVTAATIHTLFGALFL